MNLFYRCILLLILTGMTVVGCDGPGGKAPHHHGKADAPASAENSANLRPDLFVAGPGTLYNVDGFAVGGFDGVFYRFADGRVGVDAVEDFVIGGLQFAAEDRFNDDLGHVVADHMGAQPFAVFGVEDHFYEPFRVADAGSFAGGGERELADLDFIAGVAGLFFRQPGGGDLRRAIGTAGDIAVVQSSGWWAYFFSR
jgi:hypothetical protein